MIKYIVGIDPGVKTGYAIKNLETNQIVESGEKSIVEALEYIRMFDKDVVWVICEDATKWNGSGLNESEKISRSQGAGASKRESSIWKEFLQFHGFFFKMVPPSHKNKGRYVQKNNKITHSELIKYTGLELSRSNQHQRDAIMHIYDYSMQQIELLRRYFNPQKV